MFGISKFSCIWNSLKKKIYTENIDRLHLLTGYKSDGGGWLCRTRDGWTQPTRVHGKHDSTP